MSIPAHLRRTDRARETQRSMLLVNLRTRRVLEAMLALSALVDDGREKLRGEYILDRHYVESLVDELIGRAAEIVYETCWLVPQAGDVLYRGLDTQRAAARRVLGSVKVDADECVPSRNSAVESLEPEYVLLKRVLAWAAGEGASRDGDPLLGFTARVIEQLMCHSDQRTSADLRSRQEIVCRSGCTRHLVSAVRIDRGLSSTDVGYPAGLADGLDSLLCLCRSAQHGHGDAANRETNWTAEVCGAHLSLRGLEHSSVRLEIGVDQTSDAAYLFLYVENSKGLEKLLPAEFTLVKSPRGMIAWIESDSSDAIESALTRIGQIVFSEPSSASGPDSPHGAYAKEQDNAEDHGD